MFTNFSTTGYKLVILGECCVGKSCIMNKFANDTFIDNHETTIGAAFMVKSVQLENRVVKFEIWDTAVFLWISEDGKESVEIYGQERYRSLAPVYYRDAKAAIVVYDVTNMSTFEKAVSWVKELRLKSKSLSVLALCGNKVDLDNKEVDSTMVTNYARKEKMIFFETSAKTGFNISKLFEEIATALPFINETTSEILTPSPPTIQLSSIKPQPKRKWC